MLFIEYLVDGHHGLFFPFVNEKTKIFSGKK
jgi:hypothetical protein